MLEVLILPIPALACVIYLGATDAGHFGGPDTLLSMGYGLVTATPLMLYANGAKLLRLSTIAILQYIAPKLIFLVAVFLFGETVDPARRVAFPLIWAALVIYSIPMIQQIRKDARAVS